MQNILLRPSNVLLLPQRQVFVNRCFPDAFETVRHGISVSAMFCPPRILTPATSPRSVGIHRSRASSLALVVSPPGKQSKAPMRCGTQPSACFRALRFTMPTSVWVAVQVEPLPNILLTYCRQNLSQTIRKAPEILGFQELFLELLGRFELPTSSLPRMRSAY